MATPVYVRELQQTSQPQGGAVVPTSGQASTITAAPQQFLAELQTSGATTSSTTPSDQTTPPPSQAQKSQAIIQAPPTQTPPTQPQYVTAEIQSSPSQSSNAQNPPQYIVVTVTDSSPPAAVVQTGVPTQVVQQVQTAQQRSVVQATTQTTKTEPGTPLNVTSLQSVHLTQESTVFRQGDAERDSQVKTQRQLEDWRELGVVMLEKRVNPFPGSLSQATIDGGLTDYSSSFPSSLPLAYPPLTFSLPVVPVGSYSSSAGPDVQTFLYEIPSTHRVQQQLQQVPVQHVYTNQVQYVEGAEASYTTSTIFPYAEAPLYTQSSAGQYYEAPTGSVSEAPSPGTPLTVSVTSGSPAVSMFVANPAPASGVTTVVAPAGGTAANGSGESAGEANGSGGSYVIQGGYMLTSSGNGSSGNGHGYQHPTRASPATVSINEGEDNSVPSADKKLSSGPQVQWLLDNYETAEGVSLPRSTLYCHYLLHCQEQKLEPVNAASFGKLIRSVGNSKYHYYGLRIKASSSLLRLMEDQQHLAMRQQPFSQKQRLKPVQKVEGMSNGMSSGSSQQQNQQQQGSGLSDISTQVQQYQQFLDASRALPEFPDVDLQGKALPEGITLEHLKSFQLLYREHCEAILDVMVNLQFPLVETLWKTFWRFSESQAGDSASLAVHDESEKRLPKSCLVMLCKYEPVLRWSRDCDNQLYQGLVEMLIPEVLRPIPSALTQAIRNFAKSLESWLTNAMVNVPEEMVRVKAARAVLQNTAQINQMLSDLNRVDFANVQEQASWVCRCEDRVVQRLEQDFKLTLQQQNSLEQWAAWLDAVVSQVLKPYQSSSALPKAAKLFLLKWSFYSSMVIRDLTLRSAASFGSFHLIRLLYDEYMYYLIEHRVAQAKGQTPIAVMGEFASLGRSLNPLDPDKEEEEEEEEESDDECQELSLQADMSSIGDESLEPPAKLARTDQRVLFATTSMDN
ncbi:hypothetical protein DNTS_018801 [Danionella cerebrum]|uniref:RFX-type winged-helix domain-containing protein n=1 Tax=Danionella cerebrum TaxID=2873325 RepID=A0A553QN77_9TELE|nr:hypothetical protein DNTS_018801 [Danionella translucida]